jgi:tetratricopeptide (TPR) repeat protein
MQSRQVVRSALRRSVVAALFCASSSVFSAPADDIRALMEAGRAAEAFALGRQHPEALGDPGFDFYYGIAAIDTGNAGEGVLALERYMLVFPDNVSARLQLARAYFALGEDARAREEFEALRKASPPADTSATIDRYLDAIRLRESRYTTSSGFYAEAGIGVDSNVNGGVSNANIFLPNLGNVVLAPAGTKNADTFTHFGLGGHVTHPIAPGIALFGTGQAEWKSHANDKAFDLGNYNVSGGVSLLRERNLWRAGLIYSLITIDGDRFRSTTGASGEWQHQIDERQSVSVGGQLARLDYEGANSPRTADFAGLSAGYRRLFAYAWQPILSASVNAGREDAIATGREDLSRDLYGARLGVSFTPAAKWGASLGYTYQRAQHRANDLILGVTRKDDYHAFDAAVSYLIDRNFSLRGEALLSRNRSNIQLYDFPRDVYAVKLRYEFK